MAQSHQIGGSEVALSRGSPCWEPFRLSSRAASPQAGRGEGGPDKKRSVLAAFCLSCPPLSLPAILALPGHPDGRSLSRERPVPGSSPTALPGQGSACSGM